MTSVTTILPVDLTVSLCENCGHAQSGDLPNLDEFYSEHYRISLTSDDFDQLVTAPSGTPVYRTELQAQVAIDLLELTSGANLLDYGAGKATTLRRILMRRQDVNGFVFDVSDDYSHAWRGWLPQSNCATHSIPPSWEGRFDAVTAHFVLEHVADPVAQLRNLRRLLAPNGRLMITVPDLISNPVDLIAVDHLSHFSAASIGEALSLAGFNQFVIDRNQVFPGAIVCVACLKSSSVKSKQIRKYDESFKKMGDFWAKARSHLEVDFEAWRGRPSAIFGAGVYGAWISTSLPFGNSLRCFLDNNTHLQATTLFDRPILSPSDLPPEIEVVYVGLNPQRARDVVSSSALSSGDRPAIVWLK